MIANKELDVRQVPATDVYEIDPTTDGRWEGLLQRHSGASVFHTRNWLEALKRTYAYLPVAFTTSPPDGPLTNAIPFCEITGLFGKRRLVSLPFSDCCQPLVETPEELDLLVSHLLAKQEAARWAYIELRPAVWAPPINTTFERSESFCYHRLDLRPKAEEIFGNLHKNCVQRKIHRAEKEHLIRETGRSDRLLRQFYWLLVKTRRRQGLPVQPIEWFHNLIDCFGTRLSIHVASKDGRAVAAILTLCYKQTLTYKYGCSDRAFSRLGGMQFLLWRAILEAKQNRLSEFDLGRSEADNTGLITFKNRWGAKPTEMVYFRHGTAFSPRLSKAYRGQLSRYMWSLATDAMVTAAGRALYRHLG